MPILRAGPWGNLTDSFQDVPSATDVELTHYPVNIAKGNWPNQQWAAWYEVSESGCCTPASVGFSLADEGISGTFLRGYEALDDNGEAILVPVEDLYPEYPEKACTSYGWVSDDGDYFANLVWISNGTDFGWSVDVLWGDIFGFEIIFEGWDAPLSSNDECDPAGTYEDEFSSDIMTITND